MVHFWFAISKRSTRRGWHESKSMYNHTMPSLFHNHSIPFRTLRWRNLNASSQWACQRDSKNLLCDKDLESDILISRLWWPCRHSTFERFRGLYEFRKLHIQEHGKRDRTLVNTTSRQHTQIIQQCSLTYLLMFECWWLRIQWWFHARTPRTPLTLSRCREGKEGNKGESLFSSQPHSIWSKRWRVSKTEYHRTLIRATPANADPLAYRSRRSRYRCRLLVSTCTHIHSHCRNREQFEMNARIVKIRRVVQLHVDLVRFTITETRRLARVSLTKIYHPKNDTRLRVSYFSCSSTRFRHRGVIQLHKSCNTKVGISTNILSKDCSKGSSRGPIKVVENVSMCTLSTFQSEWESFNVFREIPVSNHRSPSRTSCSLCATVQIGNPIATHRDPSALKIALPVRRGSEHSRNVNVVESSTPPPYIPQ